ncbi:hypothetical protein A2Z33_05820 [Candidatus Gottesmanbacteria bacterium RBG_16_52_11]|uniref:Uncharacterized protein n=1 Tax=Candidatus Gottesmanbacteria bacterium RBG_16_52_11 TaxID=1798374 RepID=A0A1F5YX72_9BACT|nr:MAG: hypothetical protein A2Z33_05820 [Candidatus Gottesmanbacteria bacterium RBG_16_52_11]
MAIKKSAKGRSIIISPTVITLMVAVALIAGVQFQKMSGDLGFDTRSRAGNSAPSGPHFNLNIIGVPKDKTASMTGSAGHRIFVPLAGKCNITLSPGEFQVLDGNCTDNNGAAFQLPNPDPNNDGVTEYSVYARALGKPGGKSTTTTCATDPVTGEIYCSVYSMVLIREKGKSSFSNVSQQLLYIYYDLNGDGKPERYNLFNEALQDYFWSYDNNGLKLAQLRFYDVSTYVNP